MRLVAAILLLTFSVLSLAGPSIALAEEKRGSGSAQETVKNEQPGTYSPGGPVHISTDRMEVDDTKREVTLIGKVMIRWEDVVLTCDRAAVLYREIKPVQDREGEKKPAATDSNAGENPGPGGEDTLRHEIVRIEAKGHVKVVQSDQVALSGRAVYDPRERVITLTDSPQVWRGKDLLTGSRITVYLEEDRSVIESGPGSRVNATFFQTGGNGKQE